MKYIFGLLFLTFTIQGFAQKAINSNKQKAVKQIVDVACGQCQFNMKTQQGCDLAVSINGKTYFVDGANIDAFGDAHATDGFCNAITKAEVIGTIKNNRFKATYFKPIKNK
ncbi:DUF6370 family protein [Ferruginibacter yonginensis]|uniref:DUF6370 family protein n=1 Tax=Ferruginibacter yonginensis TaxID=1310416 RepID=A0ABV8QTK4_9BACT